MELEAEVAKLKEENEELRKKQVGFIFMCTQCAYTRALGINGCGKLSANSHLLYYHYCRMK